MQAERGNLPAFTLELSAFMSAARSVLQYALEEAKRALEPLEEREKAREKTTMRLRLHPRRRFRQPPLSPNPCCSITPNQRSPNRPLHPIHIRYAHCSSCFSIGEHDLAGALQKHEYRQRIENVALLY